MGAEPRAQAAGQLNSDIRIGPILTAPHVGFMCPGLKTPVLCIRFYFQPENKELPLVFQHGTFRSESLEEFLPF